MLNVIGLVMAQTINVMITMEINITCLGKKMEMVIIKKIIKQGRKLIVSG
jgi:hypothetical protein